MVLKFWPTDNDLNHWVGAKQFPEAHELDTGQYKCENKCLEVLLKYKII